MYSYDESLQASIKYFNGNELAAKVFCDKYALRDNDGNLLELTPDDMHHRIAKEFARIEKDKFKEPLEAEEIYGLFENFKYIVPQGSPMYGIGNTYTHQSLGNCFTLGKHPYDSYGGILYADQMLVQLSKRRCGVGLCLDNIRPKGLPTKNAAKTTDGIAVFMERFSNSTREVAQSGRRGACLQGLSVHHPEIETFINIKRDKTKVTGANISVLITDEFMDAVSSNKDYEQRWPVDSDHPKISKMVSAKNIWDQIISAAHNSAEPGVLFLDTAKRDGLSHQYSKVDSRFADRITNPCGEIWMGMDSCRLMLINLYSYVIDPFTKNSKFDYDLFSQHVTIAQRLMDNMVDLEIEKIEDIINKIDSDPEPDGIKQIEKDMWFNYLDIAKLGRRTGLGITGLGDALAALGIKYGSKKSVDITNSIYRSFAVHSMLSSCRMAEELGPFPLYDKKIEKGHIFLERLFDESDELKKLHNKFGRRNISLTTTAPAGSVSILTETTSGIEPAFLLEYTRRRKVPKGSENITFVDANGDTWEENKVYHKHFQTWRSITGKEGVEDSPYYKATANDIDWKTSVQLQATAQKWITHSISKTCNVPSDTPKELIEEIYLSAYKSRCKGFTVYRDGCRDGVLVSSVQKEVKRPKEVPCDVHHVSVKSQPYFVLVGLINGQPYEIFAGKNGVLDHKIKSGQIIKMKRPRQYKFIGEDESELTPISAFSDNEQQTITRLISISLQSGTSLDKIITQLDKTDGDLTSFSKAIIKSLKKYIKDGSKAGEKCPQCSGDVIYTEGCKSCSCGWSKC